MKSVFTRAYSYRERVGKSNLENYLIEIFAFCLENDRTFWEGFMKSIQVEFLTSPIFSTQEIYDQGRPDIEISSEAINILIECKIEAGERKNQLDDYKKILRNKKGRKLLIYLTKYYKIKDHQDNEVSFLKIKWWDIYNIIKNSTNCSSLTNQLALFLQENEIAMDKNFNSNDLLALERISGTISKMDEVLDSVKEKFKKNFGELSKSRKIDKLKQKAYLDSKDFDNHFEIDYGFMHFGDNLPYLVTRVLFKKEAEKKYVQFFQENLLEWEKEFDDTEYQLIISKYTPLKNFIDKEREHVLQMINFLNETISTLASLKERNKELF